MTRLAGRVGLIGVVAVWLLSLLALSRAMELNLAAGRAVHQFKLHRGDGLIHNLEAGAVFFAGICTVLQVAAGLLMAFTLRAAYRWRTAICYALAILTGMAGDALALVGLLVWMRFHDPS